MSITRLSQQALGERAYETGRNVTCAVAYWGWQGQPATVQYETRSITRLSQYGIGVAQYPVESDVSPVNVVTTTGNWGWQKLDVTIPAENVYTTTGPWGYTPQEPILCSFLDYGYPASFNGRTWPTCVFNQYVFGQRGTADLYLGRADWGWQSYDATVVFEDPIDVSTTAGNWGWFGVPVGVPYGYDIQTTIGTWGWTSYYTTVEKPTLVETGQADWGWLGIDAFVGYSLGDIGGGTETWGWQALPVELVTPTFDINLRWGNWGWQAYPITVRQTALLPGDIDAIADAVWAKMVFEGAAQQWLEVWQRMGMDPAHPQTFRHPQNGGNIEVAGITVEQTETDDDVTQHRQ